MIENARKLPAGAVIESDISIVGRGAAGSRSRRDSAASTASCRGAPGEETATNARRLPRSPTGSRNCQRNIPRTARGGPTNRAWAGPLRVARPMCSVRSDRPGTTSWIPDSGWPHRYEQLEPYLERANGLCEVGPFRYGAQESFPGAQAEMISGFDQPDVVTFATRALQPADEPRPPVWARALEKALGIRVLLGAHTLSLDLADDRTRIVGLRATTSRRALSSVVAGAYVLACGGLENARLLPPRRPGAAGDRNAQQRRSLLHLAPVRPLGWIELRAPTSGFIYGYEHDRKVSTAAAGSGSPPHAQSEHDDRERHRTASLARS